MGLAARSMAASRHCFRAFRERTPYPDDARTFAPTVRGFARDVHPRLVDTVASRAYRRCAADHRSRCSPELRTWMSRSTSFATPAYAG